MNFKENIVSINLLNTNYKIDIKINKYAYKIKENKYKIIYVLDSEPDITKTILITLN
jgi:predicted alpha/beta superfamily hydrolase